MRDPSRVSHRSNLAPVSNVTDTKHSQILLNFARNWGYAVPMLFYLVPQPRMLCSCAGVLFLFLSPRSIHAQNWTWRGTAPLRQARSGACVVRLADDRVMISGGTADDPLASVEVYQSTPEEKFVDAGSLNAARSGHGCAVLKDGRVLVAGGGAANIEVYEPSLDTWTSIESPILRAKGTTVTALPDGRALITGGKATEIEVFDADTSTITLLTGGGMLTQRDRHSVTVLRDGRLLLAGGIGTDQTVLNSAEILDPDTGEVSPVEGLAAARAGHSATALLDGRVLLAGGTDGSAELSSLEVWIPDTGRFQLLGANLKGARQNHMALLSETNGVVLLAGGLAASEPIATSELFDPSTDSIQDAGSLTAARSDLAGIVLADGTILATGGRSATGASSACGLLPSPSFRFSQSVYHPLERATVSGTTGLSTLNGPISFNLVRVDSTGKSTSANPRLIATSGRLVNGNLASTPVVTLARDDIGSVFVLTLKAVISSTQSVSVQVRFNVKLRSTLQITGTTGAIVAGQPVGTRTTLTADGANVNFSGVINIGAGLTTLAKSVSATAASFSTENTLCCPTPGTNASASGVLALNATYGGNVFLEPSSASGTQIVVSRNPGMFLTFGTLRLATPSPVTLNVSPIGPDLSGTNVNVDPALRPTGSGTLKPASGAGGSSSTLQAATSNVFSVAPAYPASQAAFSYTPTLADRRAGSVCFDAAYSGDARYAGLSGLGTTLPCAPVTGAPTVLQAVTPPSTYVLGTPSALTARLTWPNSVGIVNRNVNVLADAKSTGSVGLTPDPTGLGLAQGSANILLPFNARNVVFTYDQSGDLLGSQTSFPVTMSPVATTMTARVASSVISPFSIGYTLTISNQGVTIPGGTSLGAGIEFRDNGTLIQTLPPPAIPSGVIGTISDGSVNTILPSSLLVNGSISNVILPLGQHTITIRFNGSAQFQASQAQVTVLVQ